MGGTTEVMRMKKRMMRRRKKTTRRKKKTNGLGTGAGVPRKKRRGVAWARRILNRPCLV
jgi:hypothetical protein